MDDTSVVRATPVAHPQMIVEYAPIAAALKMLKHVTERRNTLPILSNCLISATSGVVRISTTDLDIDSTVILATAAADARFSATVPVHMLADMVDKAKGSDMISMDLLDPVDGGGEFEKVRIDFGGQRKNVGTIGTLPTTDWPTIPRPETWQADFTVASAVLFGALTDVQFAISTEETRYYLNGIYMHRDDAGRLHFVTTNGHQLSRRTIAAPDGTEGMPGVLIPRKTAAEVVRLLKPKSRPESCRILLTETKIEFRIGDYTLISKLIDGTFPEYTRVIPSWNDTIVRLDTEAFDTAVRQVATIKAKGSQAVKLSISRNAIMLSAQDPDTQSVTRSEIRLDHEPILPAPDPDAVDKEADEPEFLMEIGFNAKYLTDFCGVSGAEMTLHLSDPGSPAVIRSYGDDDYIGVLMPMRA
jgi:DNA polymerase-3 subunit beta